MCLVTLYRDVVDEKTKLLTDVARFEIDVEKKSLRVYSLLGEAKEYNTVRKIKWQEADDSLTIEMDKTPGAA